MEIIAIRVGNAKTLEVRAKVSHGRLAMVTIVRGVMGEVSVLHNRRREVCVPCGGKKRIKKRCIIRQNGYFCKKCGGKGLVNMATRNTNVGSVSVNARKTGEWRLSQPNSVDKDVKATSGNAAKADAGTRDVVTPPEEAKETVTSNATHIRVGGKSMPKIVSVAGTACRSTLQYGMGANGYSTATTGPSNFQPVPVAVKWTA